MYNEILRVWRELEKEPDPVKKLSSVQKSVLIETLAALGRVPEAEEYLSDAVSKVSGTQLKGPVKATPTEILYAGLFRGLLASNQYSEAVRLVARMNEKGLAIPSDLLGRLLQILVRENEIDVMLRVIEDIFQSPIHNPSPKSDSKDKDLRKGTANISLAMNLWVSILGSLISNEQWKATKLVLQLAQTNQFTEREKEIEREREKKNLNKYILFK